MAEGSDKELFGPGRWVYVAAGVFAVAQILCWIWNLHSTPDWGNRGYVGLWFLPGLGAVLLATGNAISLRKAEREHLASERAPDDPRGVRPDSTR